MRGLNYIQVPNRSYLAKVIFSFYAFKILITFYYTYVQIQVRNKKLFLNISKLAKF